MSDNRTSVSDIEMPANENSDNNLTADVTQENAQESQGQSQQQSDLPKSFEKRINKMYAENRQLAESNQQLSQRLQFLEQQAKGQQAPQQQQQQDDGPKAPSKADYPDPYDYAAALVKYEKEKIISDQVKAQQQAQQSQRQKWMSQIEMTHAQRVAEAKAKYEDMEDAMESMGYTSYNPQNVLHQEILTSLYEQPNSGELAYYFAKNPQEFNELFESNPKSALIKLGRLSYDLEQKLNHTVVSHNPEPINQERGSLRSGAVSPREDFRDFRKKLFKKK